MKKVKDLFRNSDFFKTLVLNSMMAMNKILFSAYLLHEKSSKFRGVLANFVYEYNLSKEMMFKLRVSKP